MISGGIKYHLHIGRGRRSSKTGLISSYNVTVTSQIMNINLSSVASLRNTLHNTANFLKHWTQNIVFWKNLDCNVYCCIVLLTSAANNWYNTGLSQTLHLPVYCKLYNVDCTVPCAWSACASVYRCTVKCVQMQFYCNVLESFDIITHQLLAISQESCFREVLKFQDTRVTLIRLWCIHFLIRLNRWDQNVALEFCGQFFKITGNILSMGSHQMRKQVLKSREVNNT